MPVILVSRQDGGSPYDRDRFPRGGLYNKGVYGADTAIDLPVVQILGQELVTPCRLSRSKQKRVVELESKLLSYLQCPYCPAGLLKDNSYVLKSCGILSNLFFGHCKLLQRHICKLVQHLR